MRVFPLKCTNSLLSITRRNFASEDGANGCKQVSSVWRVAMNGEALTRQSGNDQIGDCKPRDNSSYRIEMSLIREWTWTGMPVCQGVQVGHKTGQGSANEGMEWDWGQSFEGHRWVDQGTSNSWIHRPSLGQQAISESRIKRWLKKVNNDKLTEFRWENSGVWVLRSLEEISYKASLSMHTVRSLFSISWWRVRSELYGSTTVSAFLGDGKTEKVESMRSGTSSRILAKSSEPRPEPVPPPRLWLMAAWKNQFRGNNTINQLTWVGTIRVPLMLAA